MVIITEIRDLKQRLESLERAKERKKLVREAAVRWNCSLATVYRYIRACGDNNRKRKHRTDRGKSRITELQEHVKTVFALKERTRHKGRKSISTEDAIEICEDSGMIPEGILTVSTADRVARELGIRVRDFARGGPSTRLVTHHPNEVWTVDGTVCEQYYLRDEDGKPILRRDYEGTKNKALRGQKILCYGVTDDYSRAQLIRYTIADGERDADKCEFLLWAMRGEIDRSLPIRGIPKFINADKGFVNGTLVKKLLKLLGVEILPRQAGNKKMGGKRERGFMTIQTGFESRLMLRPVSNVEELNALAVRWLKKDNYKRHPEFRNRRKIDCWLDIYTQKEHLRELPSEELIREWLYYDNERTADGSSGIITFENRRFVAPEKLWGQRVWVLKYPDGRVRIQSKKTGEIFEIEAERRAWIGEYHSYSKTAEERNREEVSVLAKEIEVDPFSQTGQKIPRRNYFPVRGEVAEIEVPNFGNSEFESVDAAKRYISERTGISLIRLKRERMGFYEHLERFLLKTLDRRRVEEFCDIILREMLRTGT